MSAKRLQGTEMYRHRRRCKLDGTGHSFGTSFFLERFACFICIFEFGLLSASFFPSPFSGAIENNILWLMTGLIAEGTSSTLQ